MTKTPEKRPGPFAEDPSRTPPTKQQRENDYGPEKKETGEAAKGRVAATERKTLNDE